MSEHKTIRCAIYTRKSTEEGLEQAFNSLDAQREACVAYIASQRHEGWVLSPELYDDGGFSGGNMNRPGLTQLMAEVQAGRIQVIVVYKVDRLTRSLADFAKIVEVLDAAGASFVSVTQSFNTTTSMGRLTLNVLLSFAQFEREVTGERIRDKIAASKRKGMWMGGPVPLGYDVQDRKLVVNRAEAATVQRIFARYLELGSVVATVEAVNREGLVTKVSATSAGGTRGGIAWARGSLAHLLTNRVYIGEVIHKGEHFQGEHEAITSTDVWEATQAQLASNRIARASEQNLQHNKMLRGLLYDGLGRRMHGSQANRGAKRYHYYITNPTDAEITIGPSRRVPASELEATVIQRLRAFLTNAASLDEAAARMQLPDDQLTNFILSARALAAAVDDVPSAAASLLRRVDVHDDRIELIICLAALLPEAVAQITPSPTAKVSAASRTAYQLSVPMTRIRRGKEVRLVIGDDTISPPSQADPSLIKLMANARGAWQAMLAAGDAPIAKVAVTQGYSVDHFTRLLRISTLAPCIVNAIVRGRQPITLTRQRLAKLTNVPTDWAEQRAVVSQVVV
ncbi:DNA invertase Pin-like site-specific DNA recombinase [Polymorphobacter multimanifer]|uniref:DNA invertase Pin-like site-specific DNA recombinase n=2 Tax=Polymorphobacter multimanifer TaxID=1070431 RepID=A0A841LJW3_9SPHN|nr:recombinase family protein [Polymorphobacter multimanifer]MBB6229522.1 DNA invertase Pin-like site-specific DNA recombinase [Polymorphobacter multimanifer]